MRKLILQINLTLDGVADHTAGLPDEEVHRFFTAELEAIDTMLLGRVTYELMEYWHGVRDDPAAEPSEIEFADRFVAIPKVVFSRTLETPLRDNERLVRDGLEEEVSRLKRLPGKSLSVGGVDLAGQLMRAGLVDEILVVVHPVLAGKGRRFFDDLDERRLLRLIETRTLGSGAAVLRYALTSDS